jgi:hypothetical protein
LLDDVAMLLRWLAAAVVVIGLGLVGLELSAHVGEQHAAAAHRFSADADTSAPVADEPEAGDAAPAPRLTY